MPGKGKTTGWEAFRDRAPVYDTTMIPVEKHKAFETLLRELYEEFFPNGTTEEDLIHRLAVLRWERDRLYRYEQFKMEIRQAELNRLVPRAASVARLKLQALEVRETKTMKEVETYLSELENPTSQKSEPLPSEKPSDPGTSGNDILDSIFSLPELGPANGREVFFKLVEEFPIIERLKKLELIDVVIDRTIKRFMQVKTMKQIFRQAEPKTISVSPKEKN